MLAGQTELTHSIEFHDSTVLATVLEGTSLRISVDAYVHRWNQIDGRWKGTGRAQPVQLVLLKASSNAQLKCPADLDGGEVRAGQVTHSDLVPLPFDSSGPATLRLELKTGDVLEFEARNLVIEPTGEGRYVEDLPDEFMPSGAG